MTPRAGAPAPVAADPGVAQLVLLAEREGASAADAEASSAPGRRGAARDDCLSWGRSRPRATCGAR
jgi:hypothetical protein